MCRNKDALQGRGEPRFSLRKSLGLTDRIHGEAVRNHGEAVRNHGEAVRNHGKADRNHGKADRNQGKLIVTTPHPYIYPGIRAP